MKKILLFLIFVNFQSYSQINNFTGTWGAEKCKGCKKDYFFRITIAQSNYMITGTAEVTSNDKELNSGVLDVTGYVYSLSDRAQIKLIEKDGSSFGAYLIFEDGVLQFTKRGGNDLVPKELILKKLYE
ncbi:hypothetical protein [Flavobacterium defluvii]|uniref:NlpE N-terminal domain-containing protein n=1 Tax=Flavobacterium defluvii TaxID=370979 RepID=A0A1M5TMU0_9FLAO|nr:hypothetical protein [Flavobacterium defluvii]SHH51976.1 hypothetical protein SAMN05443663_108101 [Flavobacterium defluvii]